MFVLFLILGETFILCFSGAAPVYIPTKSTQGLPFLCILTKTCYFLSFYFFTNNHSAWCDGISLWSVMIGDVEHLFHIAC